jgi:hypothetical protein
MEEFAQRTGNSRRRRRKAKANKNKVSVEPVLIAARRPDSPLIRNGSRSVIASAQPKRVVVLHANGAATSNPALGEDAQADAPKPNGNGKRRDVRIVQLGNHTVDVDERRRRLLDRLVRAEGRSAITRVADDLADNSFGVPKEQELQLQLLEHANEERAREALFIIAELLQKEAPIKRPILDQRLRRLEEYGEDPITRDAAAALRKSIRLHHG